MSSNPFKTKEFKALFKKWNRILNEKVENFDLPNPPLIEWHSHKFKKVKEDTIEYYDLALSVLENYPFKHKSYRQIWELHCEGFSIRQISEKVHYKKSWIHVIITNIQRTSGLIS